MRTLCGTILGAMVVASAQAKMEAAFGIGNSRYDGIIRSEGASVCRGYAPPLLMNGELAMTVKLCGRQAPAGRAITADNQWISREKRL